MGKAIVLNQIGGEPTLQIQNIDLKGPKDGQVLVKNVAIGINEDDIHINTQGAIPGYSASGDIVEIGDNVSGFAIGDSVAYMSKNIGCYQEYCVVNANDLVALPDSMYHKTAAAAYFSCMMAHALAKRVFFIRPNMVVLIHDAASGIGYILSQLAKISGAIVIGTVDDDEKKEFALKHGCHKVINYSSGICEKEALNITQNQGVNAVYDQRGIEGFDESIKCLTKMGKMVCYGAKAQSIKQLDTSRLAEKSIYLTFPSIFDYKENRMELVLSANDVFGMIAAGEIKIKIDSEYSLERIAQAHQKLKTNKIMGSILANITI